MTRVLIADDQPVIRDGLAVLIDAEPDMEVVGRASNGREAVAMALLHSPDVIVMDIRMPEMDGIEATAEIRKTDALSGVAILVLTTFRLDEYVFSALRAGASGFLLKDTPMPQLLEGIRVVSRGDALLDPSVTRSFIEQMVRGQAAPAPASPSIEELTPRERDIWTLVARGLSNAEIADELVVTPGTVKTHVHHLLAKLDLRDRSQLVIAAYESGIVIPSARPGEKPPRG
jgi:DNA-binding NarL/FixJ family response regulator